MGHTDVVPVTPSGWSRDPFGGELVDGEVWGRGAIDMLNLTASMAVATKHLARQGLRPKGTLRLLRRRRRGGRWPLGRGVGPRPRTRRRRRGLRDHRVGGLVIGHPGRPEGHDHRRREGRRCGAGCASTARPGTARCPSAPTTHSSRRPRSCAASRRTEPRAEINDLWRELRRRVRPRRRPAQGAARPRHRPRGVPHASRPGHRQVRPRVHAHDLLAECRRMAA